MMFFIGEPAPALDRLARITQECLYLGIDMVKPGVRLGDIGHAIQQHAESNHYSVVLEYCGHGIGKGFHEEPQVLHYGRSEEHTSELQSRPHLVCRLLLEKK